MDTPLELDRREQPARCERAGDTLVVHVTGDFDLVLAPAVAALLIEEHAGEPKVIVDMSCTTFCDSSGIRALFAMHQWASESTVEFAVRSPARPVRRVLEICKADEVLRILDDSGVGASS